MAGVSAIQAGRQAVRDRRGMQGAGRGSGSEPAGLAAIAAGHHAPFRFAASRPHEPAAPPPMDSGRAGWFTPGPPPGALHPAPVPDGLPYDPDGAHPRHARSRQE